MQHSDSINKRAGGRRRYNAARQQQARARRAAILELVGTVIIFNPHGLQTRLADRFGVNRSTICRDVEALRVEYRHLHLCRTCGALWSTLLKDQARWYRLMKRRDPHLQPSCCVASFLVREADTSRRQRRRRVWQS